MLVHGKALGGMISKGFDATKAHAIMVRRTQVKDYPTKAPACEGLVW